MTPLSIVGRAGLEKRYDRWLRGVPGVREVAVDSMGRVIGLDGVRQPRKGYTLVTTLDAKVQAVVEKQLERGQGLLQKELGKGLDRLFGPLQPQQPPPAPTQPAPR